MVVDEETFKSMFGEGWKMVDEHPDSDGHYQCITREGSIQVSYQIRHHIQGAMSGCGWRWHTGDWQSVIAWRSE
jgi:hypothetical protein